jgi:hypothetical protein
MLNLNQPNFNPFLGRLFAILILINIGFMGRVFNIRAMGLTVGLLFVAACVVLVPVLAYRAMKSGKEPTLKSSLLHLTVMTIACIVLMWAVAFAVESRSLLQSN